jgi:F-type H+-transporting ATPase subunit b
VVGYFAASQGIGSLFTALGINVQSFVFFLIAFMVTVYIVGRWVFPPLNRALDAKREELEAAARHEDESKKVLENAEKSASELLTNARKSADEIIATAHADAASQLDAARRKATEQTERIVSEAREQLDRDVQVARRELKTETAKLVAGATENVLDRKLDDKSDAALIGRSLEEAK